MISLGIESTAHTFGVGIVTDKGEILANEKDMLKAQKGWGIIPVKAAEHHKEVKDELLKSALQRAGLGMEEIDIISFSQGAGLAPCLHVGLNFASELSNKHNKPLVAVNHQIAHIEIGRLTSGLSDPITLYTSGANTQVLGFVSGRYRCFGETMDVGIGNALDKFGREAGLEFPAGPKIEQLARESACVSLLPSGGVLGHAPQSDDGVKPKFIELPYVVKGMDLSFSGIVTDALQKLKSKKANINDLCFSLQETLFAMLAEVTERALAHTGKSECLLTGGVAANSRLAQMMEIMCRERGARFSAVPRPLAADNAAMIAWTGVLMRNAGMKTEKEILPRQRTDEVEVGWMK